MNALSALTTDAASDDFLDALELAFAAEDRAMERMRLRRRAERAARRAWSGASDLPTNARQRST
jgi:DNA invertase Pin-like site-specific DNA recombinase